MMLLVVLPKNETLSFAVWLWLTDMEPKQQPPSAFDMPK